MNVIDIFIILLFVGVATGGFFAGVARMVSVMVGMYFATVLSATFYQRFADLIQGVLGGISDSAAEFSAFVLLFVGLTLGLAYVIFRTTHPVSPRRRFAIFDSVGGATLSVIVAFVSITMSLAVTAVMLQAASTTAIRSEFGAMSTIDGQLDASELAPFFLELLPYVTLAIQPWFPGGLPPILEDVRV